MIKIASKQIIFTSHVAVVLEKYRQIGVSAKESGGILLGEVSNNSILISKATTPNSQDKSSRFGFTRIKKPAQLIINYEHENSDGKITYLGEWHSHPED